MTDATPDPARAELVLLAAGSDDAALALLVAQYHDRVYRFGRRVCHDAFDADDAVQEAFVKLARRPDVMADRGALSWLMSVVRNACLRLLRPFSQRTSLHAEGVAENIVAETPHPEAALEKFELVRQVQSAIAGLPAAYRQVLILRDLEGLSGDETARLLELDPSTMKTRLHRARALLRERLLARR
jgi:RNA polymerase sigma-70 factor (ECF subfamily)